MGDRPVKLVIEKLRTRINEERIGRHFDDRIRAHARNIQEMTAGISQIRSRATDDKKYTVTNGNELRTIDVSTATVTDVANALHTLLGDLKAAGLLK